MNGKNIATLIMWISLFCVEVLTVSDHTHLTALAKYVQESVDYQIDVLTEKSNDPLRSDLLIPAFKDEIIDLNKRLTDDENYIVQMNAHIMAIDNSKQVNHTYIPLSRNDKFTVFGEGWTKVNGVWSKDIDHTIEGKK